MPIYNAPIFKVDPKETRRYAGLQRAVNFDEKMIEEACEDARLLADPHSIWQLYDYDCLTGTVLSSPTFQLAGNSIRQHLAGCEQVILLAATVGEEIEHEVTRRFEEGSYTSSVLLDAAATTAVEQVADALERAIEPDLSRKGMGMRWRFSPGYGDWPLEQQPELIRLSHAEEIGISLSEALMLIPRKSITAVIGLFKNTKDPKSAVDHQGCASCSKKNCPSRKIK